MRILEQRRVEGQPEEKGVQERCPGEKGRYGKHNVELQRLLRAAPAPRGTLGERLKFPERYLEQLR